MARTKATAGDPEATDPTTETATSDGDGAGDLGVFAPPEAAPRGRYTIPVLEAFRDNPTRESHLAAAAYLHRTGPLVLDGELFSLLGGRVVRSTPRRNPHEVVRDDPAEVVPDAPLA